MQNLNRRSILFALVLMWGLTGCPDTTVNKKAPIAQVVPDRFGIYTATADGKNMKAILNDPTRELNHARVSPDGRWITYTRYNKFGGDGLAIETNGYEKSEIMISTIDGQDVKSLVPPRDGIIAANGYWTPDGKSILYVSSDNPDRLGQINRIEFDTGRISQIPTPAGLSASDPHLVNDRLVYAVFDKEKEVSVLWIAKHDGSEPRQLTFPKIPKRGPFAPSSCAPFGDFDPKLSPDGRHIAFMRQVERDNWHTIIVEVETGVERDLSSKRAVDAVPEWSSDDKALIFWHVDPQNIPNSGLYTISPDRSNRVRIPLPRGYFHTMPSFFPADKFGPEARIIFSAKKEPLM